MGGGAAGGLCCHQNWSPSWPPSCGILRELEIRLKPREMVIFCA